MIGQAPVKGLVARFETPGALLKAARSLREVGLKQFDAHSPYPIHGMDDAMREPRSRVSYVAAAGAIAGGTGLLALIYWASVIAYPVIVSGKPLFSYQAFFPPIFAITVLLAAFGSLAGFIALAGVKFHHSLFESPLFARFSDDGFIIAINADDPLFEEARLREQLAALGAVEMEAVHDAE
ncbi:MAG: DUF3341 domain-containing protein [Calditrichaeota bacterium]|nr:DUF3341 domain-containing protein [Calditrichota bacterium]